MSDHTISIGDRIILSTILYNEIKEKDRTTEIKIKHKINTFIKNFILSDSNLREEQLQKKLDYLKSYYNTEINNIKVYNIGKIEKIIKKGKTYKEITTKINKKIADENARKILSHVVNQENDPVKLQDDHHNALNNLTKQYHDEIKQQQEIINQLIHKIDELENQQELSSILSYEDNTFNPFVNSQEELFNEITNLKAQLEEARIDIDKMHNHFKNEIAISQSELNRAENEKTKIAERLNTVEVALRETNHMTLTLQSQLRENTSALEMKEIELKEAKEDLERLQGLTSLGQQEKEKRVISFQTQITKLSLSKGELTEKNITLKNQLNDSIGKQEALEMQLKEMQAKNHSLKKKKDSLKESLTQKNNEIKNKDEQLQVQEAKLHVQRSQIKELKDKLREIERTHAIAINHVKRLHTAKEISNVDVTEEIQDTANLQDKDNHLQLALRTNQFSDEVSKIIKREQETYEAINKETARKLMSDQPQTFIDQLVKHKSLEEKAQIDRLALVIDSKKFGKELEVIAQQDLDAEDKLELVVDLAAKGLEDLYTESKSSIEEETFFEDEEVLSTGGGNKTLKLLGKLIFGVGHTTTAIETNQKLEGSSETEKPLISDHRFLDILKLIVWGKTLDEGAQIIKQIRSSTEANTSIDEEIDHDSSKGALTRESLTVSVLPSKDHSLSILDENIDQATSENVLSPESLTVAVLANQVNAFNPLDEEFDADSLYQSKLEDLDKLIQGETNLTKEDSTTILNIILQLPSAKILPEIARLAINDEIKKELALDILGKQKQYLAQVRGQEKDQQLYLPNDLLTGRASLDALKSILSTSDLSLSDQDVIDIISPLIFDNDLYKYDENSSPKHVAEEFAEIGENLWRHTELSNYKEGTVQKIKNRILGWLDGMIGG